MADTNTNTTGATSTSHPPQQHDPTTIAPSTLTAAENTLPPSTGMKKYNLMYTTSRMNVRMHPGPKTVPAEYYLETKISLTKPQIILRRGSEKKSPIVAAVKMLNMSRHMVLCKGDPFAASDNIVWEKFERAQNVMKRSNYEFATAVGNPTGERQNFTWFKDMSAKLKTVYECQDGKGRVVGKMLSGGAFNFNKGGEVEVAEDVGRDLVEMLIVSAMAIWAYEALEYQSLLQGF
jgi:hypothetical protein